MLIFLCQVYFLCYIQCLDLFLSMHLYTCINRLIDPSLPPCIHPSISPSISPSIHPFLPFTYVIIGKICLDNYVYLCLSSMLVDPSISVYLRTRTYLYTYPTTSLPMYTCSHESKHTYMIDTYLSCTLTKH